MSTDHDARTRGAGLYSLAPDGFISGRDALVRELNDAGETDLAAAVKKLRKPSIVAWAVNAAAREHPDEVKELVQAGDALRRAQQAVVSGGADMDLRETTLERRRIIASLVDTAAAALGDRAQSHRDAIALTLEAASVDPELGMRLRDGTLEREAVPGTGLGSPEGLQLIPGGSTGTGPHEAKEAATRRAEAEAAERAATTAERDADRAARRAEQLRDKARRAVEAADAAGAEARRLADEARTIRRRATRAR